MSELLQRYLVGYEDFNGIDGIASEMRDQAEELKCNLKGLRRLVEHPSSYEMDADVGIVISVAQFDRLAERDLPGADKLVDQLLVEWRALLHSDAEDGVKQRALYALVRIEGPECEEALRGLESGRAADEEAVLCALTDPVSSGERFEERLPDALSPAIVRLCKKGAGKGEARGGRMHFELPLIFAALRLSDSTKAIRAAIDNDALAPHLPSVLDAEGVVGGEALATLLGEDFEAAVLVLEQGRDVGLPNRGAMARASLIARLVGAHGGMASRATDVLDLLPGLHKGIPSPKPLRASSGPAIHPVLTGFTSLLMKSVDELDIASLARVATHLLSSHQPFFPCAGFAWTRLPVEDATRLAEELPKDGTELLVARLDALALALAEMAERPSGHIALVQGYASAAPMGEAMQSLLKEAGVDETEVVAMIRRARSLPDLVLALDLASTHGLTGVLRSALKRLREAPFRLTTEVESLLRTLIDDTNVDFIDDEVDGENPFRDRREALQRLMDSAGS